MALCINTLKADRSLRALLDVAAAMSPVTSSAERVRVPMVGANCLGRLDHPWINSACRPTLS